MSSKQIQRWEQLSAQGNSKAQCNLGMCYFYGKGVEKDYKKAVTLFTKSAEQGCAKAKCYLGECHYFSKGVEQDPKIASGWFDSI